MRGVSSLALIELLAAVVAELDERGQRVMGTDGMVNDQKSIDTAWGDLRHDEDGWVFVWYAEGSAELALCDRPGKTIA